MIRVGFDCEKYVELQSRHIRERIEQFGGKLYLEFGGKLFDDYHAARVLPGFMPSIKIDMLTALKDEAEIVIVISANDIEGARVKRGSGDLKVDKAGMVHKNYARLVFAELFHAYLIYLKVCGYKIRCGNYFKQRAEKHICFLGLLVRFYGKRKDFFIIHCFCFDFHSAS